MCIGWPAYDSPLCPPSLPSDSHLLSYLHVYYASSLINHGLAFSCANKIPYISTVQYSLCTASGAFWDNNWQGLCYGCRWEGCYVLTWSKLVSCQLCNIIDKKQTLKSGQTLKSWWPTVTGPSQFYNDSIIMEAPPQTKTEWWLRYCISPAAAYGKRD